MGTKLNRTLMELSLTDLNEAKVSVTELSLTSFSLTKLNLMRLAIQLQFSIRTLSPGKFRHEVRSFRPL